MGSASCLPVLVALGLLPAAVAAAPTAGPLEAPRPTDPRPWSDVQTWVYQLQGYPGGTLDQIGTSAFDLAVIDYSSTGEEAGEWTPAEIEGAQQGAGGPRRIVSYMSIGEAEDYRFYWQPGWRVGSPDFIVQENPDWPGNYKVKYWDPQWQAILFGSPDSYLDRILDQGFDGVYLDIVDAYDERYAKQELGGVAASRQAMVDLVLAIGAYGRARRGNDFAVFPQNAEEIAEDEPEYLAGVNGIGKEETYFEATNRRVGNQDRFWTEENLDRFLTAGPWGFGLVLEVDYASQAQNVEEVYDICMNWRGYTPYCTNVDLDRITVNAGHEPWSTGGVQGLVTVSGVPAEGASVQVERISPSPRARQTSESDADGLYGFGMVAAGTWRISASLGGLQAQQTGWIRQGRTETVNLELTAP